MSRLCPVDDTIFFTYELGVCIPRALVAGSTFSRKHISFDDVTGLSTWLIYESSSCDSAEFKTVLSPQLSCSVNGTSTQSTWSSSRAGYFDGILTEWFSDSLCTPGNVTSSQSFPGTSCVAATESGCTVSKYATFGPYQKISCQRKPKESSVTCFAGSETVQTERGAKAISEVRVGDRVLAAARDETLRFARVVAVPHAANSVEATFLRIDTASTSVRLTPDHLLLSSACGTAAALVRASDVGVGDCVRTTTGSQAVTAVSSALGEGLYTVVTEEEFVVVGGVIASPFALNHAAANAFYGVHRALFALAPSAAKSAAMQTIQHALSSMLTHSLSF